MNLKEDTVKRIVAISIVILLYVFGLALLFLSKIFWANN